MKQNISKINNYRPAKIDSQRFILKINNLMLQFK